MYFWSLRLVYYVLFKERPQHGMLIAFKDFEVRSRMLASPWAEPFYRNFLFFIKSAYFGQLMRNTRIVSFLKLFVGVPFSVLLAYPLSRRTLPFRKSLTLFVLIPMLFGPEKSRST